MSTRQSFRQLRNMIAATLCIQLLHCFTRPTAYFDEMHESIPRMKGLPPALRMRSAIDRALACRWHLGTFPIHYRFLCSIGRQNYVDDLKLLTKKKTSPIESTKLRIALRVISSISELEHPTVNQD